MVVLWKKLAILKAIQVLIWQDLLKIATCKTYEINPHGLSFVAHSWSLFHFFSKVNLWHTFAAPPALWIHLSAYLIKCFIVIRFRGLWRCRDIGERHPEDQRSRETELLYNDMRFLMEPIHFGLDLISGARPCTVPRLLHRFPIGGNRRRHAGWFNACFNYSQTHLYNFYINKDWNTTPVFFLLYNFYLTSYV